MAAASKEILNRQNRSSLCEHSFCVISRNAKLLERINFGLREIARDGTRQWLLFAGSSLGNNQCVEFCVDISERKKAEEALRESEEQFRVLAQNLVSAVALINAHGEFSIVNKSFLHMFDLDEQSDILNINSRDWSQWRVFDENGRLMDADEHPRFQPTQVLDSILALLERKLQEKRVAYEKEFLTDTQVCGVESEVRQVFWNLLTNSLDGARTRILFWLTARTVSPTFAIWVAIRSCNISSTRRSAS